MVLRPCARSSRACAGVPGRGRRVAPAGRLRGDLYASAHAAPHGRGGRPALRGSYRLRHAAAAGRSPTRDIDRISDEVAAGLGRAGRARGRRRRPRAAARTRIPPRVLRHRQARRDHRRRQRPAVGTRARPPCSTSPARSSCSTPTSSPPPTASRGAARLRVARRRAAGAAPTIPSGRSRSSSRRAPPGLPKGALYCNRQLAFITQTDVGDAWDGGGRSFSGTSFAHLGFMTKLPGSLRRGGTTFIMERWHARPRSSCSHASG